MIKEARMMRRLLVALPLFTLAQVIYAADPPHETKCYFTARIEGVEPSIDGKLDDEAWQQVDWGGSFVGHRPEYNVAPSQETRFKILYDAKYLYVGIRAYDTDPEQIVKRMSRRDGFDGDWVEINIDSYNDKRTAFSFTASVSGVKGDEYVTNNGNDWDGTWDPIWYLETSLDNEGWIAEFKIPLSQLRFADKEEHVWGIQLTRRLFRIEERSTWQPIDPQAPGWVHLFGELRGIKGIRPQKQLEIQPYVVGQMDKYPKEPENPFKDQGRDLIGNVGIDAKVGITSDITLDLTVNPDFGQVEADPSVVNLSAYEQFFRERRPFFLEGNNLFTFQTSGGPNNLFYSRRIGRPAQGSLTDSDIIHSAKIPNTRILSAGKLTGKNSKGFSWGALGSLTGKVEVEVEAESGDSLRERRMEKVEPYTTYGAFRVQQDIKEGQTVVGAFMTFVSRSGNRGNDLQYLHDEAQTAGVDLVHNILDRKYGFTLQFSGSRVAGTPEAITQTQNSFVRNYQRVDNDYRSVDTTRTTMTGTSSRFQFGKKSGSWVWEMGINHRSPGLELNDVGFLASTDNINSWLWSEYRVLSVKELFRSQRYGVHIEQGQDFSGKFNYRGFGNNVFVQFNNLWNLNLNWWYEQLNISNADLRGGPAFRNPNGLNLRAGLYTNFRKKLAGYVSAATWQGQEDYYLHQTYSAGITIRPIDALLVSLDPEIFIRRSRMQWVDNLDMNDQTLYLLSSIRQTTYSMSARVNYNITPNLTLELWAQPFMATGEYHEYKQVSTSPRDGQIRRRYIDIDSRVRLPTESELADYLVRNGSSIDELPENYYGIFNEAGNQMETYLSNPDFNSINWRSNFVIRWEYIPGSTLFLVWSNNSSYFDQSMSNSFTDMTQKFSDLENNNTFLIKYTYRFIL